MKRFAFFSLFGVLLLAAACTPNSTKSSNVPAATAGARKPNFVVPQMAVRLPGVTYPEYGNGSDIPLALDGPRCELMADCPGPTPDSFYLGIRTGRERGGPVEIKGVHGIVVLIMPKTDESVDVVVTHIEDRIEATVSEISLVGPHGQLMQVSALGPTSTVTITKEGELKRPSSKQ